MLIACRLGFCFDLGGFNDRFRLLPVFLLNLNWLLNLLVMLLYDGRDHWCRRLAGRIGFDPGVMGALVVAGRRLGLIFQRGLCRLDLRRL